MSFKVFEVVTNVWEGSVKKSCIMQSDSEILCYRQALELQKAVYSDPGSPVYITYEVMEESK